MCKLQNIVGPQIANLQIATLAEGPKFNKLYKYANLLICNLPNLFADRPPLTNSQNVL